MGQQALLAGNLASEQLKLDLPYSCCLRRRLAASRYFDNPEDVKVDGEDWVFAGRDVRAEVGGMSWDDYVLSADVWVDRTGPDGRYCVQLTGRGTCIYCQLVPGWILIAYYDQLPQDNPRGFKHLARREVDMPERTWLNFQMKAEAGTVTAYLAGREIVSAAIPSGTQGMPGLLVNQQSGAEVRIRNVRVEFLNPTPEQLREYATDASENWDKYAATHGDSAPDARLAEDG